MKGDQRLHELVTTRLPLAAPSAVAEILVNAFTVGAAIHPAELLPGGEAIVPLWADLAWLFVRRGWHAEVCWTDHDPRLVLLPSGKTSKDYDRLDTVWVTAEQYGDDTRRVVVSRPWEPGAESGPDLEMYETAEAAWEAVNNG